VVSNARPRVYLDADVFVSVLKAEDDRENCREALEAAQRGDIQLVASRLLLVEVGRWAGDRPGQASADELIERFLEATRTEWVEVDIMVAREARRLSWELHLRSADAIHLATAVRRGADYFMSHDTGYPLGQTVDGVDVREPSIVWQPTLDLEGPGLAK
jgi:predicted nucleic acid-binding protein